MKKANKLTEMPMVEPEKVFETGDNFWNWFNDKEANKDDKNKNGQEIDCSANDCIPRYLLITKEFEEILKHDFKWKENQSSGEANLDGMVKQSYWKKDFLEGVDRWSVCYLDAGGEGCDRNRLSENGIGMVTNAGMLNIYGQEWKCSDWVESGQRENRGCEQS